MKVLFGRPDKTRPLGTKITRGGEVYLTAVQLNLHWCACDVSADFRQIGNVHVDLCKFRCSVSWRHRFACGPTPSEMQCGWHVQGFCAIYMGGRQCSVESVSHMTQTNVWHGSEWQVSGWQSVGCRTAILGVWMCVCVVYVGNMWRSELSGVEFGVESSFGVGGSHSEEMHLTAW